MKIVNQLKPECDGCLNFELDANAEFELDANAETENYFFGDGRYPDRHITINCKKRVMCDHLCRYLVKVSNGKE